MQMRGRGCRWEGGSKFFAKIFHTYEGEKKNIAKIDFSSSKIVPAHKLCTPRPQGAVTIFFWRAFSFEFLAPPSSVARRRRGLGVGWAGRRGGGEVIMHEGAGRGGRGLIFFYLFFFEITLESGSLRLRDRREGSSS